MKPRSVAFSALLAVAACSSQPDDLVQGFDWEVSRADMRDALHATCAGGGLVFAAGGHETSGLLLRWVGRRWVSEPVQPAAPLHACAVGGDGAILAVGESGTIHRRNGEGWRNESLSDSLSTHLFDVLTFNDGSAIAVGADELQGPVALHYDRSIGQWQPAVLPALPGQALRALWATSSSRVWAVGDAGSIVSFDGQEWAREDSEVDFDLRDLHGSGAHELFAVGGDEAGIVLRRSANRWSMFAEVEEPLTSAWTAAREPLYVAGRASLMVRFDRRRDAVRPDLSATRQPDDSLCATGLIGLPDAVFATAVDCETQRGAMLSHGRSFAGPLFLGR